MRHIVSDPLSRILIWKRRTFLEQKRLAEPNSSVPWICDRLDTGTLKSFRLPDKQTSFFTGSINQMKTPCSPRAVFLLVLLNLEKCFVQHIHFQKYHSPLCISEALKLSRLAGSQRPSKATWLFRAGL